MIVDLTGPPPRIDRPELTRRLTAALDAGHAMVIAGAGYGKTMALEAALASRAGAAAWVRCTPGDRDGGRLLMRVLRAVSAAVPGVADVLLFQLAAAGGRVDAATAQQRLLDDIDALLVEPLTVVFDDAEALAGAGASDGAAALVEALLASEQPRLRVAVLSRARLGLRTARAEAGGRIRVFDEGDLAFSEEECAAALRARRGGQAPEPDEVERLMVATLGWPMGVTLGAGRPATPTPTSAAGLDAYLEQEVLDRLDPAARALVLRAASLPALTPPLIEAASLPADVPDRLAELGLLVRSRPEGGHALHPLLRAYLAGRWEAERAGDERTALLDRVAAVLAGEGETAAAVDAWLAAGRHEAALAAVRADAATLLRTSPGTVRAWLERLPAAAAGHPVALLLRGQAETAAGQHAAGARALERAHAGFLAAGDAEAAVSAAAALQEARYWAGELEAMAAAADRLGPGGAALELVWAAVGAAALGDVARARALSARAAAAPDAATAAGLLGSVAALLATTAGEHEPALAELRRLLDALPEDDPWHRREHILSVVALLEGDRGRHDAALEAIGRAGREVERSGLQPFLEPLQHVLAAWYLALSDRPDEAELALAGVRTDLLTGWDAAFAQGTRALLAVARGEHAAGAGLAEQAWTAVATAPLTFRTYAALGLAAAFEGAGRGGRAEALLAEARADLDARVPGADGSFHRARLMARGAWLAARHDGAEAGAARLVEALEAAGNAAPDLVRSEWRRLEPVLPELLGAPALDPEEVLGAVRRGVPDAEAFLALAEHPRAAVRRAVVGSLAASGRPQARVALKTLSRDGDPEVAAAASGGLAAVRARTPQRTFRTFGGFRLEIDGWTVDQRTWGRSTVVRLVRLLLVHRDRVVPEDEIVEHLWPEHDFKAARSALQVAVSRARAVLDAGSGGSSAIRSADRTYRLVLGERDRLDADDFLSAARSALGEAGPRRRALLEVAAERWTGEPLPEDRYAEWARAWRDALEERRATVLRALLAEQERAGDHLAAAETAGQLVRADPLDEPAHRGRMRALARAGRRGHALRQFLECRRALDDGFAVAPGEETIELQRAILAGRPV